MPCGRMNISPPCCMPGIPNVEMHIYARGKHGGGLSYRGLYR